MINEVFMYLEGVRDGEAEAGERYPNESYLLGYGYGLWLKRIAEARGGRDRLGGGGDSADRVGVDTLGDRVYGKAVRL